MQRSEGNLVLEIVRIILALLSLPFSLFRRTTRSTGARRQSARCAGFDAANWTPELLKHLEWRRFEELCVAYFQTMAFKVETRPRSGGGADLALHLEGAGEPTVLAHCMAWSAYPVGIKPLQDLHAAMAPAGVGEALLVAAGKFAQPAVAFAAKHHIELIDGARLLGEFAALAPEKALALLKVATKGDFLTPTCPDCSIKMISRKSTGEGRAFWGCENYPRCKQTFSETALAP
jgi:restriction system protein